MERRRIKPIEELMRICNVRAAQVDDDTMELDTMCDMCPKKDMCDTLYELAEVLYGSTPYMWNIEELEKQMHDVNKYLMDNE